MVRLENVLENGRIGSRLAACLPLASLLCAVAAAAAPMAPPARTTYIVVDQDVASVIGGIAAELGLRADVSSKLRGRVHGRLELGPPEAALDRLGTLYDFDWFSDGRTLYASRYDEAVAKVLLLGSVGGDEFTRTLDALRVANPRWPIRLSPTRDVAMVDGPPHYVEIVEETLEALARRARAVAENVHVFRGAASGS